MTEPLDVLVQAAFMARLTTPALTSPATAIAYPFVPYTPTPKVAYLDARAILRAATEHPWLAFSGSDLHRGIFQVDAVVPDGDGEAPGLRLASLVAARFAIGTELTAGAYKVRLLEVPTIATAVQDAPWIRFPVSIPYIVLT